MAFDPTQLTVAEASRRIVQDIVYSAGGEDMDGAEEAEEYSPSIIVKDTRFQDDTF